MILMYKGLWVHIPDKLFKLPAKRMLPTEELPPLACALLARLNKRTTWGIVKI